MWFCYMTQAVSNFWTQRYLTSSWYYRHTLPCLPLDLLLIVDGRRLMFSTSTSTPPLPPFLLPSSLTFHQRKEGFSQDRRWPLCSSQACSVRLANPALCMEPQGFWLVACGMLWQRSTLHLDSRQCGSDTDTGSGKEWQFLPLTASRVMGEGGGVGGWRSGLIQRKPELKGWKEGTGRA